MMNKSFLRRTLLPLLVVASIVAPTTYLAATPAPTDASIDVKGLYASDKAQRGRVVPAAIVLDIPENYHVNANKLVSRFGIPTTLKIEAPAGVRISPVSYPRGIVRHLGFSDEPLSVYEGRAVMRFNITIPANYQSNDAELHVRVHYQSCNNEVCFPPTTRDVSMSIPVVGASDSVKRINGDVFGGGKRRR